MPEWFETFADQRVLTRCRERSARLVIVFAFVSGALVAAAPVASLLLPRGGTAVAILCGLALLAHATWLLRQLSVQNRAVWCVRLSARHLVADDGGRRRHTLPWIGVIRVDLGRDTLTVDGLCADGRPGTIEVPVGFEGHAVLSRRLTDYAVAHRCVICVDGEPLQSASLEGLLTSAPVSRGRA